MRLQFLNFQPRHDHNAAPFHALGQRETSPRFSAFRIAKRAPDQGDYPNGQYPADSMTD
jgi:hypothetical protein